MEVKTNPVKVSVIVPIYGVEKYIERCARSLFEQTLDDIECIFVDDCTPDQSMTVLEKVMSDYPQRKGQTKIIHHEINKGLPSARQSGLKVAKGEYIAHLDSDDWVEKDMYKTLYDLAKPSDADIAVCDFCRTDGDKMKVQETGCHSTEAQQFLDNLVFHRDSWSLWNKLIKSVYYRNIQFPTSNMGEDMAYMLQLAYFLKRIVYSPTPFYNYYINPSSITKTMEEEKILQRFHQIINNISIVNSFYSDKPIKDTTRSYLNYLMWRQKETILPLVHKKKYYKMWRETFPYIEKEIILDTNQSVHDRIKCILTILHVYPWKRYSRI